MSAVRHQRLPGGRASVLECASPLALSGCDGVGKLLFSPNGASHTSPGHRPGLSWRNAEALKGRPILLTTPPMARPFRAGFHCPTQPRAALRSALGWYESAPLGLNRPHAVGARPSDRSKGNAHAMSEFPLCAFGRTSRSGRQSAQPWTHALLANGRFCGVNAALPPARPHS